jgi:transcriptional regulator with XRE-family HTH domain
LPLYRLFRANLFGMTGNHAMVTKKARAGKKMKQKSLRQLVKELGVSASYLSQVRHGKRPASQKVLSILGQSVKQIVFSAEGETQTRPPPGGGGLRRT